MTSQATIYYLVCLKVISSFETHSKKESWIKDPYSVYRNTTPTNNIVARATAWERLAMASFNDYELKLKKKNHWELENTFHWFIPDFPGRTDKKKNEKWKKDTISSIGNFLYDSRTHTYNLSHSGLLDIVSSLEMCRYPLVQTSNHIIRKFSIEVFFFFF